MDVHEYRTARWTRLVERARELGCEEEQAESVVEEVLAAQRRRIARAEDPDPLVHAALEQRLAPPVPPRRPLPPAARRAVVGVAGGLVVALLATAVVVWLRPEPPEQVRLPSLFGLDADDAEQVLERAGLSSDVTRRPACEPDGLVLDTEPAAGRSVPAGTRVEVLAALTQETTSCAARLVARREAWRFVGFARGGPAPPFARTVTLVVDGSAPSTLSGEAAGDPERWAGLLDLLVAAGADGPPRLGVEVAPAPPRTCGLSRPASITTRPALRLVAGTIPGRTSCPLTLDLYRSSTGIDSVVAYTGR
ncbi:PASTA domain-containing protein [Nocardioides nanhaiensis]|uniref:PASTA domain-containing protein n=1 Tax=Nocardioides nanhaiensis TaxID=1476871 RepID=UPI0031EDF1BE